MKYKLSRNDVHIWSTELNWPKGKIHNAWLALSKKEQERAKRFVMDKHREAYIISHAVLHEILSRYLNCRPEDISFSHNDHGKPYLNNLPASLNLQFNMSHSGGVAMYAIALDREIGVDIEFMRPRVQALDIAARFFSSGEYDELIALPEAERLAGFYRCWARKEAYIKATGQGLSFPLNRFSVSLSLEGFNCLLEVDQRTEPAGQWALGPIPSPDNYQAALAVEGKIRKIQYFQLT